MNADVNNFSSVYSLCLLSIDLSLSCRHHEQGNFATQACHARNHFTVTLALSLALLSGRHKPVGKECVSDIQAFHQPELFSFLALICPDIFNLRYCKFFFPAFPSREGELAINRRKKLSAQFTIRRRLKEKAAWYSRTSRKGPPKISSLGAVVAHGRRSLTRV